jgi:hypothetical protein
MQPFPFAGLGSDTKQSDDHDVKAACSEPIKIQDPQSAMCVFLQDPMIPIVFNYVAVVIRTTTCRR